MCGGFGVGVRERDGKGRGAWVGGHGWAGMCGRTWVGQRGAPGGGWRRQLLTCTSCAASFRASSDCSTLSCSSPQTLLSSSFSLMSPTTSSFSSVRPDPPRPAVPWKSSRRASSSGCVRLFFLGFIQVPGCAPFGHRPFIDSSFAKQSWR